MALPMPRDEPVINATGFDMVLFLMSIPNDAYLTISQKIPNGY